MVGGPQREGRPGPDDHCAHGFLGRCRTSFPTAPLNWPSLPPGPTDSLPELVDHLGLVRGRFRPEEPISSVGNSTASVQTWLLQE